jgi:long-chain acyl-CoA synthetase
MMGYYREPELTRAAFTDDGWLRTGDKGAFDEEGNLRITGRVKDLFKTSKGKYVAPAPIEARLATHPAIEACCVTGAHRGQPLALAMLTPDAAQRSRHEAGRRELQRSLGDHLAAVNASLDHHERLDGLVLMREAWSVENDLLTPTFKVRRGRIDERFAAEFEGWAGAQEKVIWHGA